MPAPHHFPENRFVFMSLGPNGLDISIDEEATTEEILTLCGLMVGNTIGHLVRSKRLTIREASDFIIEQIDFIGDTT